ncbi:hypothetical protein BRD13_08370 [Halobacteriales archaeon SW_5_70_135]|nr:MAG: hypothetical protein BRD13_08370 [Halobacteriales archaeon SW_5_70_135]
MGFRCSILGCEYDGTEHEREREQRGEEVVLTVREYEECRRCGDRRVISENTGVTTTPAAEADGDRDDPDGPPTDDAVADDATGGFEVDGDDAVLLDETEPADEVDADDAPDPVGSGGATPTDVEAPADEDGVEFLGADTDADADADIDDAVSAAEATVVADVETPTGGTETDDSPVEEATETDDAVFLRTAAPEDGPQADARTGADVDPTGAGEDEPAVSAPNETNDAVFLDGAGTETETTDENGSGDETESADGYGAWPDEAPGDDPEYDHGAWPGPTDGDDADASTTPDDASEASFSGVTSGEASETDAATATATATVASAEATEAEPTVEKGGRDATVEHGPGARTTRTDADGDLRCRACGFGVPPRGGPHRAGDVCPDCGSGYLGER